MDHENGDRGSSSPMIGCPKFSKEFTKGPKVHFKGREPPPITSRVVIKRINEQWEEG